MCGIYLGISCALCLTSVHILLLDWLLINPFMPGDPIDKCCLTKITFELSIKLQNFKGELWVWLFFLTSVHILLLDWFLINPFMPGDLIDKCFRTKITFELSIKLQNFKGELWVWF